MDNAKRNVNQLKAGAIISYLSMGLGYIINIIYTPIMLRLLGQSEYGLYNLVASVVSYLGLLSFGFGSAYMRYYYRYKVNDDKKNIAKLNGMYLIIFSFISFITLIAGIILVLNIEIILGTKLSTNELAKAKILMLILVFNIAISFFTSIFNSYVTANEEYIFQKLLQLVKNVVNPFIILPVLLMGYKSVGMVIATTSLNIGIEIINTFFCFKKLKIKFSFKKFDFSLMKEMTIFSSFLFINMIIDQINWNVDKFIIGRYRGTISVAIYGLAALLNTYYMSISTTISNVFIPRVNRMVALDNDNEELTKLFTRIGRIQFLILTLICSGFIFFGRPFLIMWAGNNYKDAYFIVLLLIIPVTIPLIQNLGIEIQKAKNMHQFRSWVYLLIAIGNVCMSIPLTKLYGGVGAAIGTAISLLIGNGFLMNWYYHKKVGINIRYFWSQISKFLPSLCFLLLIGVCMNLFIDLYQPVIFLLSGMLYMFLYFVIMWLFGMNRYEKELISKPVFKLIRKVR